MTETTSRPERKSATAKIISLRSRYRCLRQLRITHSWLLSQKKSQTKILASSSKLCTHQAGLHLGAEDSENTVSLISWCWLIWLLSHIKPPTIMDLWISPEIKRKYSKCQIKHKLRLYLSELSVVQNYTVMLNLMKKWRRKCKISLWNSPYMLCTNRSQKPLLIRYI